MQVDFEELPHLREEYKAQMLVFTGGCYDLFHEGHIDGLRFSREQGQVLAVGVVSDERVKQRKGSGRPVIPELSRLAVVDAVRYVDYSFIMPLPGEDLPTPTMQVISTLRPDIFVEYIEQANRWQADLALLEVLGVKIVFDEGPKKNSTSDIINKLKQSFSVNSK